MPPDHKVSQVLKMSLRNLPIGVFDSGVGGLTVLRELKKILPSEDIVYLGDTAHLPYGTKSQNTIIKLSIENILFLLSRRVKMVVVACNSTSSVALPKIKSFFNLPILGVVEAGVEKAVEGGCKRIGIIGTPATIRSSAYQKLIKKKIKGSVIESKPCPLFVPLVEEGWQDSEVSRKVIEIYLKGFKGRVDCLILGCTHYPLLKRPISRFLKGVKLIDSAEAVARKAKRILSRDNLLKARGRGRFSFFLTDDSPNFSTVAKMILNKNLKPRIVNNV